MRQHLLRQSAEFTAGIRVHDGPKTGNRRRLPRAHRNRSGRRGPAEAIRQAPEAMQPKSGGGNRQKGNRQPKSGAEPTARQLTAENREPHAAAASAPEPQRPQGSGRSDTAGPGSHAAKIGRRKSPKRQSATKIRCGTHRKTVDSRKPDEQKSLQRRSATKIRCGTHRKTIDHQKPDEQKSLQRRSTAKNPAQKPLQDS